MEQHFFDLGSFESVGMDVYKIDDVYNLQLVFLPSRDEAVAGEGNCMVYRTALYGGSIHDVGEGIGKIIDSYIFSNLAFLDKGNVIDFETGQVLESIKWSDYIDVSKYSSAETPKIIMPAPTGLQ